MKIEAQRTAPAAAPASGPPPTAAPVAAPAAPAAARQATDRFVAGGQPAPAHGKPASAQEQLVAIKSQRSARKSPAAPAAPAFRAPRVELARGAHGSNVNQLQRALVKLGCLTASDYKTGPGTFGPRTERALKRFQAMHGVSNTGYYGPKSRAALSRALGEHAQSAPKPSHAPKPSSATKPSKADKSASTHAAEPAANYRHVSFRGVTVNVRTRELLLRAEDHLRRMGVNQKYSFSQGSYHTGVSASAGTHDGGGALDIRVNGMSRGTQLKMVKALRMAGFAAWSRGHNDSFAPHIHAIAIGDRQASWLAKSQVQEYFRGGDGLTGSRPDYDRAVGRPAPAWARKYA